MEDPAAGGGEALRCERQDGLVEEGARIIMGVGVGVPVGKSGEEAAEAPLGDLEDVDREDELRLARRDEDHVVGVVRDHGIEAVVETEEHAVHAAEGVPRGVVVVVQKRLDAAGVVMGAVHLLLLLVVTRQAQMGAAVALVGEALEHLVHFLVQMVLGIAQGFDAAFGAPGDARHASGVAVSDDEEVAELGVGDDASLLLLFFLVVVSIIIIIIAVVEKGERFFFFGGARYYFCY